MLTRLLRQNIENLKDYGWPKIQDLVGEGKTNSSWICFSYPFRHKTNLHCADRKAMVYGEWAMQHLNMYILNRVLYCLYISNKLYKVIQAFSKRSFWEIELTKEMTDLEDRFNLCKIVFDDNNQEKKSWSWLGQTCSVSLIVFLSQLFVILLINPGCLWIHLSKTFGEATVWVGILCSAAGYILPSPRLWSIQFLQKIETLFHLLDVPN